MPQRPLSEQEFNQVVERVMKTAPPGLSEQQFNALLDSEAAKAAQPAPAAPRPGVLRARTWLDTATDVGKGIAKGGIHTVTGLLEMGRAARVIPGAPAGPDTLLGTGLPGSVFDEMRDKTKYTNNAQRVGGALETAAEMAVPVLKGVRAIPSAARAGAAFQDVMGAARNVPVDTNAAGQVALRIQELADAGGTMPRAVSKFLRRITDPNAPALAYEEARDWASNISRLSADEFNRMTPVIQREMGNLRVALNGAIQNATATVGKGQQYAGAMKEYAQAANLRDTASDVWRGVKRTAPYGLGAGAAGGLGYGLAMKLKGALFE